MLPYSSIAAESRQLRLPGRLDSVTSDFDLTPSTEVSPWEVLDLERTENWSEKHAVTSFETEDLHKKTTKRIGKRHRSGAREIEGDGGEELEIGSDSDSGKGTVISDCLESPVQERNFSTVFQNDGAGSRYSPALFHARSFVEDAPEVKAKIRAENLHEQSMDQGNFEKVFDDNDLFLYSSEKSHTKDRKIRPSLFSSTHCYSPGNSSTSFSLLPAVIPETANASYPTSPLAKEKQENWFGEGKGFGSGGIPEVAGDYSDINNNCDMSPSHNAIMSRFTNDAENAYWHRGNADLLEETGEAEEMLKRAEDHLSEGQNAFKPLDAYKNEIEAKCHSMYGSRQCLSGSRDIMYSHGSRHNIQSSDQRDIYDHCNFGQYRCHNSLTNEPNKDQFNDVQSRCHEINYRCKNNHGNCSSAISQNTVNYTRWNSLDDSFSTHSNGYNFPSTPDDLERKRFVRPGTGYQGAEDQGKSPLNGHRYIKKTNVTFFIENDSSELSTEGNGGNRKISRQSTAPSEYRRERSVSSSGHYHYDTRNLENTPKVLRSESALEQPFFADVAVTLPLPKKSTQPQDPSLTNPVKDSRNRRHIRRWTNSGASNVELETDRDDSHSESKFPKDKGKTRRRLFFSPSDKSSKQHHLSIDSVPSENRHEMRSATGSGMNLRSNCRDGSTQSVFESADNGKKKKVPTATLR